MKVNILLKVNLKFIATLKEVGQSKNKHNANVSKFLKWRI